MNRFCFIACLLLLLPVISFSQKITYSATVKDDVANTSFDIIGRIGANIVVFKNARSKYALLIYDNNMELKNNPSLDFIPPKTFQADYIAYPDFFYLVYEYKKKGIVYCMAAKVDEEGELLSGPVQLDSTEMDAWGGDSRIYNIEVSENKQAILLFKMAAKSSQLHFQTILLDSSLRRVGNARESMEYDESRDVFGNFSVDNEGNFFFTHSVKAGARANINKIMLIKKEALDTSFTEREIPLNGRYADEVKLKIDNLNKHTIIQAFYYDERNGNVSGFFSSIQDNRKDSSLSRVFVSLGDSVRTVAKAGRTKIALNDFFIRNTIVKKDGGFVITAEDFSTETSNLSSPWNHWNYLYGNSFFSPFGYYYNPYGSYFNYYNPYYNPYAYNGLSYTRYKCGNLLVLSFDSTGHPQWTDVIHKEQYDDNSENYLSFLPFIGGGELHYLFNRQNRNEWSLADNGLTPSGHQSQSLPFKNLSKDYTFMPRYGKQIGARKLLLPCTYRNSFCFALIEY